MFVSNWQVERFSTELEEITSKNSECQKTCQLKTDSLVRLETNYNLVVLEKEKLGSVISERELELDQIKAKISSNSESEKELILEKEQLNSIITELKVEITLINSKNYELSSALDELGLLNSELKEEIKKNEKNNGDKTELLKEKDAEINSKNQELLMKSSKFAELNSSIAELTTQIKSLTSEKESLESEIMSLKASNSELSTENQSNCQSIKNNQDLIAELNTEIQFKSTLIVELESKLTQLEETIQSQRSEFKTFSTSFNELYDLFCDLFEKSTNYSSVIKSLSVSLNQSESAFKDLSDSHDELEGQYGKIKEINEKFVAIIDSLKNCVADRSEIIENLEKEVLGLKAEISEVSTNSDQLAVNNNEKNNQLIQKLKQKLMDKQKEIVELKSRGRDQTSKILALTSITVVVEDGSPINHSTIYLNDQILADISLFEYLVFSKEDQSEIIQSIETSNQNFRISFNEFYLFELVFIPCPNFSTLKHVIDQSLTSTKHKITLFGDRRVVLVSTEDECVLKRGTIFNCRIKGKNREITLVLVEEFNPALAYPVCFAEEKAHVDLALHYYGNLVENYNDQLIHFLIISYDLPSLRRRFNNCYRLVLCIILAQTLRVVNANGYALNGESFIRLNCNLLCNSVYFFDDFFNQDFDFFATNDVKPIEFLEKDCLECAIGLDPATNRVGVLNMANEEHPGGGYLTGASAQEESLFRRTTLGAALDPEQYGGQVVSGQRVAYPWKTAKIDVVVTENVEIFKTTEATGCQLLEKPQRVTIISTAAPQNPQKKEVENFGEDYAHFDDLQLLYKRWTCVFLAAIKHGITHLVICPLGCGAFRNPIPGAMTVISFALSIFHKFFDSIIFSGFGDCLAQCQDLIKYDLIQNSRNFMLPCHDLLFPCQRVEERDHISKFHHVPRCPFKNCNQLASLSHRTFFQHFTSTKSFQKPRSSCITKSAPKINSELPQCPNPYTCEYYYVDHMGKTSEGAKHLRGFKHICRYSGFCKDVENEEHCRLFDHVELEVCEHGVSCEGLKDPLHRFTFSHEPIPVIPYKCKFGDKCDMKNDPSCYRKYGHWNVNQDPEFVKKSFLKKFVKSCLKLDL
ncbi:hypothetical protein P9112_013188 [Eukaryota sp. TZLM1-RC]